MLGVLATPDAYVAVSRARSARPVFPAARFAWSAVELLGDVFEVVGAVHGQVGALGEVLPWQAVGAFIQSALPG